VIDKYVKSLDELPAALRDNVETPKIKPGQVLVDIKASALNFFDVLQVQGKYQSQPPFPWISGFEFSGIVSAVNGKSPYSVGDRVFGGAQGAYAEQIAVNSNEVILVPEGMSFAEASGLFVTYPTSYAALVYRANVQAGETVLVHAAAGGVGLAACQIAKALGAKVIATAGSEEKLKVAKEFGGADHAIDYTKDGWEKEVKKLIGGKGVDVIYDPIGMINKSLKCIAWNGRIIVVGFAAGSIEKIPANQILLKNIAITGVFWGAYSRNEPERIPETWAALLKLFQEKKLKPVIFKKPYDGLEGLADGLKALSSRGTYGKVVLSIQKQNESKL